ncbi:DNA-binding protein c1d [Rhizophlyctis rosea]|nr:DNA-binding protein c1d [Rhizophlyctis rosea]
MNEEDTLLQGLDGRLSAMEDALAKVKSLLNPLVVTPLEQLRPRLEPLDRAKLEITLAFAINTLAFNYLRTEGIPPKDHPVKRELDRIKAYFKKQSEAAAPAKASQKIDQQAATRFINAALNQNEDVRSEIKKRKAEAEAERLLKLISSTDDSTSAQANGGDSDVEMDDAEEEQPTNSPTGTSKPKKKKKKKGKSGSNAATPSQSDVSAPTSPAGKKRKLVDGDDETPVSSAAEDKAAGDGKKKRKKKKGKGASNSSPLNAAT